MSVLIKGIHMPKNEELIIICSDGTVEMTNNDGSWVCEQKAIELPPHGLIDKQMLLRNISENQFTNSYVGHEDEYAFWDKVWDYIINAPTIIEADDSIKQGRWMPYKTKRTHKNWWQCSLCGFVSEHKVNHNFCPNCGARMENEGENA